MQGAFVLRQGKTRVAQRIPCASRMLHRSGRQIQCSRWMSFGIAIDIARSFGGSRLTRSPGEMARKNWRGSRVRRKHLNKLTPAADFT